MQADYLAQFLGNSKQAVNKFQLSFLTYNFYLPLKQKKVYYILEFFKWIICYIISNAGREFMLNLASYLLCCNYH